MHPTNAFHWSDRAEMLDFVREHSFAHIFSASEAGLFVVHAPVLVKGGRIWFHVSRRNAIVEPLGSGRALVSVTINSVSSLNADTSLVRFTTTRADPGAQAQPSQHWAAVITWRYSGAEMTADDRLLNPLGFQVTRYRRDAETVPEPAPPPVLVPVIGRPGPAPAPPGPGPGAAITAVPR